MFHKYRPKDNIFYITSPEVMLTFILSWVFLGLLSDHPLFCGIVFTALQVLIIASGNYRSWKKQFKYALPLIIFIVFINAFLSANGTTFLNIIDYKWLHISFSIEGLAYGTVAGIRLLIIVTAFNFLSLVIDPDRFLNITSRLGYQLGLIVNLSSRLFPLMLNDFQRIQEIQKFRSGVRDNKTLLAKIKGYVPTLTIMLVSSLEKSLFTAESLYCRGYGSGKPSNYNRHIWQGTDYMLVIYTVLIILYALWLYTQGWLSYNYYPSLSPLNLDNSFWVWGLVSILFIPIILNGSYYLWQKFN